MQPPDEPTALRSSSTPPPRRHDARFTPGTVLADRFRIIALLGKGGMGEVYRAEDMKLGQQVALKFLPATLAQDHQKLERLYGEVRLGRQVSHPNVCRLYDVVEWEGNHFISMEYIDGEDLASLLRRIGKLPHDKALDIARDLGGGISAAHAIGIVHRDLKPANVMIDGRGVARITDFGLAALSVDLATTREISGTPAYMAPEQLTGGEVTQKTDLYALGLILYEMFTGKRLFDAQTVGEMVNQHRSSHSHSISQQTKEIDPAVQRVILRCLEEKPENRPPSIHSVINALPGGDPLQAALEAGETPSPEMIAAAGEVGELQPTVAWGALALAIVSLAFAFMLTSRTKLYNRVSFPNEPEVLTHRAREIITQLGYPRGADSSHYFGWDEDYFTRATRVKQRREADDVRPSPVIFRYRESPEEMIPVLQERRVLHEDPPFTRPGMTRVGLDPNGRLLYFGAIPPEVSEPPNAPIPPTNWSIFFSLSGIEHASLREVPPTWTGPSDSDQKKAWDGRYPTGEPVHIEAASYRGKPIWFEVIGPWRRSAAVVGLAARQETALSKLASAANTILLIAAIVIGAMLARRHYRRGRGDRRGAFRIALFIFACTYVARAFRAHHTFRLGDEFELLQQLVSEALFEAAIAWILYLALEPYIRRRWPRALISWSRLLAGRVRDPLVGQHLLSGVIVGALFAILMQSMIILGDMTPLRTFFTALTDSGQVVHIALRNLKDAVGASLMLAIVVVLAQIVFRRRALALAAVSVVMILLTPTPGENTPLELMVRAVGALLILALFFRAGILGIAAASFVSGTIFAIPTTLDPSRWYFSSSLVVLILLAAIAIWSFRSTLADQPMFGKLLLEDEA